MMDNTENKKAFEKANVDKKISFDDVFSDETSAEDKDSVKNVITLTEDSAEVTEPAESNAEAENFDEGNDEVKHPKAHLKVQMTADMLYDVGLYHMYSTARGFFMNIIGLMIILAGGYRLYMGEVSVGIAALIMLVGVLELASTPMVLKHRAKERMQQERYKHPIHYTFDNEGIHEELLNHTNLYAWDRVSRAVNTPKCIAFYVDNDQDILIFPKHCFDEKTFLNAMYFLSHNVVMGKIFIH